MRPAMLFDRPLDEAVGILWITPVGGHEDAFVLQAVVETAPADLAIWLAARGRTLTECRFTHPDRALTYLTVDHAFDRAAAQDLASTWDARFYEPPAAPCGPASEYRGQSLWGFSSIEELRAARALSLRRVVPPHRRSRR